MYYMGFLYEKGIYVSRSEPEAKKWYDRAALVGHAEAAFKYACLIKSFDAYQRACKLGYRLSFMRAFIYWLVWVGLLLPIRVLSVIVIIVSGLLLLPFLPLDIHEFLWDKSFNDLGEWWREKCILRR